jgi:hypothetical protein
MITDVPAPAAPANGTGVEAGRWLARVEVVALAAVNLGGLVAGLLPVPPDVGADDLARAWAALAASVRPDDPGASSRALALLQAVWPRQATYAASACEHLLRTLAGRLQAGNGTAGATLHCTADVFGTKGCVVFPCNDGCAPVNIPTSCPGFLVAGFYDCLAPGHPLRGALGEESGLYWLGDPSAPTRRWCVILGGCVGDPADPRPPDVFNLDDVALYTSLAADVKRQRRQEAERQRRQIEERETKAEIERLRALRAAAAGGTGPWKALEELESEAAALRKELADLRAGQVAKPT